MEASRVEKPSRERPWPLALLLRKAGASLDAGVGLVWVEAELARVSRPRSGHVYMELRDGVSALPAVAWASTAGRLKFRFEEGLRVRLRGRLGVYDRDGKMQLYIDFAEPAGAGDAAQALEELKQKLAVEGLFANERKRPLPRMPRRIGVVTSRTGAALRDIVQTIHRRFPTPILVAHCTVQGATAPREIVHALARISRPQFGVDVIILGRGGGSAADLAAFNAEAVVRAVAACRVPVISAVGHEVDIALSDLAADCRASTPTAAAELAVPVRDDLLRTLGAIESRLARELRIYIERSRHDVDRALDRAGQRLRRQLADRRAELTALERRRDDFHPLARLVARRKELHALERRVRLASPTRQLAACATELAQLEKRLHNRAGVLVRARRSALAEHAARLTALSPLAVLDRGYAVVRNEGQVVRRPSDAPPGSRVVITLADGSVQAIVANDEADARR